MEEVGQRREQLPMSDTAGVVWPPLDKRGLRASFERAAQTYDEVAVLQRAIADRLLERLDVVKLRPAVVLDAGCGTGYVTRALARRYPRAQRLALDIAESMVRQARRGFGWRRLFLRPPLHVCGDAEVLPFASASVDMIVSNLTLQWCDAPSALAEFRRVLRPGGLLMFTTFGPDTLTELRRAWHAADDRPHVHGFLDMHDLGDMLMRTGFDDPVLDVERLTLTYGEVMDVLRDLKRLGAHNAAVQRARGLTGKRQFARFRAAYDAMRVGGRIPATYEAVYGHAWAPEMPVTRHAPDGGVAIPLEHIGRRR
jgi:malonyl-CoA O-methyltransferase